MKSRMTTSIVWLVGIYLALTAVIAAQVAVQEEMAPQTRVYVVKGGDTLWDISTRFLDSPWYWPQLWALNPYITNPHMIYPGEPLALAQAPQVQVAQAQPAQVEEAQPAAPEAAAPAPVPEALTPAPEEAAPAPEAALPAPVLEAAAPTSTLAPASEVMTPTSETAAPYTPAAPETEAPEIFAPVEAEEPPLITGEVVGLKEAVYYAKVTNRGFISPSELGQMGVIVKGLDDKIMLSAGDKVFTNLGDASGVQVGDRFSILEQVDKVLHPNNKSLVGYQIEIMGDLEIIEINGEVSTAKILHSYNVVSKGNFLRAFESAVKEINLKECTGQIDGFVIGAQNPVVHTADNDIIYLDRGSRDGLEVGNLLLAYRLGGTAPEPGTKMKMLKLPPRLLGKILIVEVKDGTAAALITSSLDTIQAGDRFRSGI